jgi:NAD(P)H-dependent flavin oxidoreductase YrpB (nitropropane dioxygenase family)
LHTIIKHPVIIQGGMGVGVSNWRLARTVSLQGQLGVVSGTGIDTVQARLLQLGDPGGHLRRAFAAFPDQEMAARVLSLYFIEGGKPAAERFRGIPICTTRMESALSELGMLAAFAEIWLAKEGHAAPVGINFLEKIQLPLLPALYGAMLAGVDYVTMGAGIPRHVPGILDSFAEGKAARFSSEKPGNATAEEIEDASIFFDPSDFFKPVDTALKRPKFLAIVASATLAITLARKSTGRVDGFIVEAPEAGGHNAPPRGGMTVNGTGQPVYGARDVPEFEKIAALGLPFWIAGGCATPESLVRARALGAIGVQIGTAFAFCDESGIMPEIKRYAVAGSKTGTLRVFTDPNASPTGFPFKILQMPGTMSELSVCEARERVCDLGYLRKVIRHPDGTVGYACPAAPVGHFVAQGGAEVETCGRKCLCNGLLATVGLGQRRTDGTMEPPIITAGDDVANIARYLPPGRDTYSAADVIRLVLG